MCALKITTSGDKLAAQRFHKEARNLVFELKHSMVKASNPHLSLQQGKREKRPYPGVIISCISYFGNDWVNIHVEPTGVSVEELKEEWRISERFFWYAFNASTLLMGDIYVKLFGYTDLNDLITDVRGNVYVIGGAPTEVAISSGEPAIIAYDADGKFLWRRMIYSSTGFDTGTGIDIDRINGDMYFSYDQYNAPRIQNYDGGIAKYNSLGEVQWQKILQPTGGQDVTILTRDTAVLPSLDPDYPDENAALVCGRFYSYTDDSYVSFISKFDSTGILSWTKSFGDYIQNTPGSELPQIEDLTYSNGYFIAGGYQRKTAGLEAHLYPSALVMKFETDGTLVWKKKYQSYAMQRDGTLTYYGDGMRVYDTAVDSAGNIYIIAFTQFIPVNLGTIPIDYAHVNIFKISPSGTTLWQRTVEYPTFTGYNFQNPLPFSTSIAVSSGGVFIAFPTYDTVNNKTDTVVARLDKETGAPVWKKKVTVRPIVIDEAFLQGLFPKAINIEQNCLYICGSIYSGQLHVTMKLPTSGISVGRHKDLEVSNSNLIFYDNIEDVPYRLPPSDIDNGFTEHYYTTEYIDPIVTISTLALDISTVSTGHRYTSDWNVTNKILRKITEEKIN